MRLALALLLTPFLLVAAPPKRSAVGGFTSSAWAFSTRSYWIEGPEGVVLIDTQFLPKETEKAVALAERRTGKKVVAAFVLHPNPDKFNGVGWLQQRGVKVYSTPEIIARIPAVHALRTEWFAERYAPDYPTTLALPDPLPVTDGEVSVAGLRIRAVILGQGCSAAHLALWWGGHLFTGDLVAHGSHSWLELGEVGPWLQRLETLQALHPRFVHPGRGASGGPELLQREMDYLRVVDQTVARANPAGEPTVAQVAALKAEVLRHYPRLRFEVFLELGLPTLWRHKAGHPVEP